MAKIRIQYFSDILCIWAYASQRRVEQLVQEFGNAISIDAHFCSVFANAHSKIEDQWKDKGLYEGFNQHLTEVSNLFSHINVHERVWLDNRPNSSSSAHMFVKAIEIIEAGHDERLGPAKPYLDRPSTRASSELREAFFARAEDISDWKVHEEIADRLGIDYELIQEKYRSSDAIAKLAADYELSQKYNISGSPSYLMNDGRQKLFGNVGYRLIEANVRELLHKPTCHQASWC